MLSSLQIQEKKKALVQDKTDLSAFFRMQTGLQQSILQMGTLGQVQQKPF